MPCELGSPGSCGRLNFTCKYPHPRKLTLSSNNEIIITTTKIEGKRERGIGREREGERDGDHRYQKISFLFLEFSGICFPVF